MPDDPAVLADARAQRQRMIADLSACCCSYPISRCRSLSGHDRACPTHARFMERHNLTPKDRAR